MYRVRNWSAYDASLRQRGDVTIWFSEEAIQKWTYEGPTQRGAQYHYSDLAIETALSLRILFDLPLRQTEGFVHSLIKVMGLPLKAPDHSTLSRRNASIEISLAPRRSKHPLHVVVDSTGLKVYGEGEWKVRQHGYSKRRTWRKLHLAVNESTGGILACEVTKNSKDDASQVTPLLEHIPDRIDKLGADGAYDKEKVYDALNDPPHQSLPIRPVIPPRKDAKIWQHGNCHKPPLPRDENLRAIRKKGRKQWKMKNAYHRRSIAETEMFRYKQIIGATLRARTLDRQEREGRIGCKILNRMTRMGRPESYLVELAL
ncbi:MAG: IS5 family transposase [Rhodospirillales bacterium]|nr:IS5 family transposase [Rhodospirillales bacterium]